jgi:hypothetical protein
VNRLEERIRSGLQETAERIPDTVPTRAADRVKSRRTTGVWVAVAAIAAVLVLFTPILFFGGSDPDTAPAATPDQFGGEWVTDQSDGSTHTMTIEVSGAGSAEMNVEDDFASVCSGAPFQVTGTGSFQSDNTLVFVSPTLTCKDGSQPEAVSGPPLEERFRNLTFTYDPGLNTLTDTLGLLWTRGIPNTPGINWPQTNLEEVEEAQALADAGDTDYTWQLEPNMESILQGEGQVDTPEIYARFLQKELGWEEFALIGSSDTFEYGGFQAVGAQLIRCEPGKANPVWPNHPRFGGCAPTIDDLHYESVIIHVTQPGRQGPEGLWVASFLTEAEPVEQAPPITDVGIEEMMEAFIQARIAGEGAETYLGDTDIQHLETGFLYATSTGAPYDRGEFEVEDDIDGLGPLGGAIGLRVRLFAEGGQVVEQTFSLELDMPDRRWALFHHQDDQSTEDGVPLPKTPPVDN